MLWSGQERYLEVLFMFDKLNSAYRTIGTNIFINYANNCEKNCMPTKNTDADNFLVILNYYLMEISGMQRYRSEDIFRLPLKNVLQYCAKDDSPSDACCIRQKRSIYLILLHQSICV